MYLSRNKKWVLSVPTVHEEKPISHLAVFKKIYQLGGNFMKLLIIFCAIKKISMLYKLGTILNY